MGGSHQEVERAFAPDQDGDLPDLTEVTGIAGVEPAGENHLDATYYDVPGLPLLRSGVTLRRRSGGSDEGWHLKLPGDDEESRTELHEELDHTEVPAALAGLVAGWTRGQALAPVARIRTDRRTSRLVAADGTLLAELADDRVEGRPAQLDAEPRRWREWEVELVTGEPALLDDVETFLARQGVRRSEVQRKIELVLGEPDRPELEPASRKGPVGLLLHRWILDQVHEIELTDPLVRQPGQGGVHGMRKACRRLRAGLAAFRPLVDRALTDPVRDELRWLARALGPARDDQVVLARIEGLLDDEPDELGIDAARRALAQYAAGRAEEDDAMLAEVLGSHRYFDLRTALDQLALEPPWTTVADEPAKKVVPKLVGKEWKRARRRHRKADDPHEVRKATKRLRYVYEMVEPGWGEDAGVPRQAAEDVTQLLGDRQDTLVAREWLVSLAQRTGNGPAAFVFGRLHAQEEAREAALLDQAASAWKELKSVRW